MKKLVQPLFVSLLCILAVSAAGAVQEAPATGKSIELHGVSKGTVPASGQNGGGGVTSPAASPEKISVTKAIGPNGFTIAEVYAKSAQLDKKTVLIRGKVVKVASGIMKKNWIHLEDGTGSSAKGTHDLVCTTKESAKVGDIITVSGVLAKDRDFGSGYKYKVIIENAVLK